MSRPCARLTTIEELREYVYHTLCEHDFLQPDYFPMTERMLFRKGKPCGIFFCVHGPRAVKLTAIWETEQNQILFYGSTGERFLVVQLAESPALQEPAVHAA
ncbi:hypothetical protein JCM19992_32040 [Thermostilla marina]